MKSVKSDLFLEELIKAKREWLIEIGAIKVKDSNKKKLKVN